MSEFSMPQEALEEAKKAKKVSPIASGAPADPRFADPSRRGSGLLPPDPERAAGNKAIADLPPADPFGWKAQEADSGLIGGKYLDPNKAAMAGGVGAGLGTGIVTGLATVNPVVGSVAGFGAGVGGAELARQAAFEINRKRGATSPTLIGPEGLEMRVLDASANMLVDATMTAASGMALGGGLKFGAKHTLLRSTPGAAERFKDFEASGMKPSMGAVTGNKAIEGIEGWLSRQFGSWDISAEAKAARIDAMQKNFVDLVSEAGRAPAARTGSTPKGAKSAYEGGEAILRLAGRDPASPDFPVSYKAGMDSMNQKLRGEISARIGKDTPVDDTPILDYIFGLYPNLKDPRVRAKAVGNDIASFLNDLEAEKVARGGKKGAQGRISWGALDDLKQSVGEKLGKAGDRTDSSIGALQGLYRQITEAQGAVAESKGLGDTVVDGVVKKGAWSSYKDWYTTAASFRDELARRTASADPEKIFKAANSAEILRGYKNHMQPGEWHDFKSAKTVELGGWNPETGVKGDFHPAAYAKNITNLRTKSPETYDLLFEPGSKLREATERYLRVNSYLKDAEVGNLAIALGQQNFLSQILHGVGHGVQRVWEKPLGDKAQQVVAEAGKGLWHGGLALAGTRRMQKFFDNPEAIKWVSGVSRIPPGDYAGMSSYLGKLAAIQWAQPEVRDEVHNWINSAKRQLAVQQDLEKKGPLTKDEKLARQAGVNAAQGADRILKMQDEVSRIERDPRLSAAEKKLRARPILYALDREEAKRNSLLLPPSP